MAAKPKSPLPKKALLSKTKKGKETVYEYTQNQYKLESGRTSYGIDIKNASEARIVFPFKGKTDRATMVAPDDTILYMLDRHAYVPADQFWKLPQ